MSVVRSFLIAALAATLAPTRQAPSPLSHPAIVGRVFSYTVEPGDSLTLVSAKFGVELPVLAGMNDLAPNAWLQIGQSLLVDNRHLVPRLDAMVVVNVPQRIVFVQTTDGKLHAYPVAAGRPTWSTPLGGFTVIAKEKDPTWDVPVSIQKESQRAGRPILTKVPPGPDNPLGRYWLALSLPGIGIHGTNNPASVFAFTTHGCIRVGPQDIEVVFQQLPVGARGTVIYQPAMLAALDDRVLVEVHRDIYGRAANPLEALRAEAIRLGVIRRVDPDRLEQTSRDAAGNVVDVTVR